MWSPLRFLICQSMIIMIFASINSVNGMSLHRHSKKNQVLPVPPIKIINGSIPAPDPYPFPTSQSSLSASSPIQTGSSVHFQCEIVCPYDPECQKMNFQPPSNGKNYCACACQICKGQYYGPTNNYKNSKPLPALQIQNCPNFVYGNA